MTMTRLVDGKRIPLTEKEIQDKLDADAKEAYRMTLVEAELEVQRLKKERVAEAKTKIRILVVDDIKGIEDVKDVIRNIKEIIDIL